MKKESSAIKIVFFSEIRWDYLQTRKQQIISRFPKDWQILFLEPHKAGKKTNLIQAWHGNVCVATMPLFFKNFKPAILKILLSIKFIRFIVLAIGFCWTKEIIRQTGFHTPDLIMTSNIYAAPFVKRLASKSVPVIYDMNDDPMSFPHVPRWARNYYNSLCLIADRIILASPEMKKFLPENNAIEHCVITNGVDNRLFDDKKILLYVGALAEFVDLDLLERIAKELPHESLRIVGPITCDVSALMRLSNVEFIGTVPPTVVADQIKNSSVCLIPFVNTKRTAAATYPGKMLQYLAAGKPVVSIGKPISRDERINPNLIYTARSHDEFLFYVRVLLARVNETGHAKARQELARSHDWNNKANEFIKVITELTNEK